MENIKQVKFLYGVLNNETRINILLLCVEKELSVTEVCKKIKIGYTTTSEYLSMLEKAGLIKKIRKNNQVFIKSLFKILDTGELKKV